MTHGDGAERQTTQMQVDKEISLGRANRRRVVVAASATLGAAFIAAGLLAGPAFLPGIRDQIRDRDLLPVQIVGGSGFLAGAAEGADGADGTVGPDGLSQPGSSGSDRFAADQVADIILPGGQSLREILGGAPLPGSTFDGATGLVDDTVDGLTDVLQDPSKAPRFVEDTVDRTRGLVDETVSTLPLPPLPGKISPPVSTPPVSTPPVSIPGVPVTVPSVTVPSVSVPQTTVPQVTVPPITTNTPKVTLPVTLPGL